MPPPVLSTDEIREILVNRVDHEKQAVGIVVGVLEPAGRRVVAYGNLAEDDPRPLDGATIFEIGSVTKVFTSLLLADMVNHKEVALDDPAAKYLPENVTLPERNGKSITLLDLSTHTSGLPPVPSNQKPYADYSVDDLYQFLSGYTLPRDPGSEFEYSNLGAGLLGHLLARRAGTDYESLIRTRITRPLSMPDTSITLSSSMQQRMATGHNALLAPAANSDIPTPFAGAGALRSSANDMLTFLEAVFGPDPDPGPGAGYKESPLAPALRAMLEVRRPMGKGKVGLGWLIFPTDGGEIVWHNGGTAGFRSFVGYDPKEHTGVVVLCNASTPGGGDDIGFHLLSPKLPLDNPEPPQQHVFNQPTGIHIHLDPKLLDNYTGRYQWTPDRILEITRDGGRLFAQTFAQVNGQPGVGQTIVGPKFEMFAESEKNFLVKVTGSHITFETGPESRATSLIVHRPGHEPTSAPRLS